MDKSKKDLRDEKKTLKNQERTEKAEIQAQKKAALDEKYGKEVLSEMLNLTVVQIFQKGYVRFHMSGDYEKLLSVEVMANNLTKKSGFGRGVGAVFTMGMSLATPNTRGDVIVTILTDKKARTFELLPDAHNLKSSQKVAQVAKMILNQAEATDGKASRQSSSDLGEGLEKLVKLHKSGALSDEEFAKAKAKLIG